MVSFIVSIFAIQSPSDIIEIKEILTDLVTDFRSQTLNEVMRFFNLKNMDKCKDDKIIDSLTKAFKSSCLIFQLHYDIAKAFGKVKPKTPMHILHDHMLGYLLSDNPEIKHIDYILKCMENISETNKEENERN